MIALVALREIRERGRGRGYIVSTAVLLAAVVAGAILINVLGGDDDDIRSVSVGVVESGFAAQVGERADYVAAFEAGAPSLEVEVVAVDDAAVALDEEETVDVVFDGTTLTWSQFPDLQINEFLRNRINQFVAGERARDQGLAPEDLAAVFAPIEIAEQRLDTDDEDQFGTRMITSLVAGLGLFLLLQVWGGQIMLGVVEEKQSRVVEVLLSKVRERDLLAGKVLGIGALGVLQAAILVGGLALALALATDIDIPEGVWSTVPLIALCFVFGFLFYGAAFAAVGSMATRIEDVQSAQMPAFLPLMGSYMILAFSFGNPSNIAVTVASFVPFSSPLALPFRHAHTPFAWWQIAVSLGLLVVGAVVMIAVAGWVYRRSILRVESRVTARDLLGEWRTRG